MSHRARRPLNHRFDLTHGHPAPPRASRHLPGDSTGWR